MAAAAMIIGKILKGAGTTMSLYGQYKNDIAAAQKMEFDAQQAANNAELARQDAMLRIEAGQVERANISKQEKQAQADSRVSFAGGNVAVDEGSALDVDIALAEQAAREREAARDQEKLDVQRLKTEEQGLLAESRLKRKAARNARKSAKLGFIGGNLQEIGGSISS